MTTLLDALLSGAWIGPIVTIALLVLLMCKEIVHTGKQPAPRRLMLAINGLIIPLLILFLISAGQRLIALVTS